MNAYPMTDVFTLDFNKKTSAYLKKRIKTKATFIKIKTVKSKTNMSTK